MEQLDGVAFEFQMAFTSVLPSIEKMPLLAGFTETLAVNFWL